MARSHHVDLFVQMSVIGHKTKELSAIEPKLEPIVITQSCTTPSRNLALTGITTKNFRFIEIETADDLGIGPKAAHELASRQVGGPINLSYTICDHKNYLRT
ncbi:hypothetical protein U9M48_018666 [Paspalum notatum var. saurae]|uniref:Uncharacterized protein n=1 Tax=Paspalum notatum var. saurae TaxID=547442 RepID=A0AAQ3TAL7_PASNO